MTADPSPIPKAAAESELPVVGYADTMALADNVADGYPYEYLTRDATHKRAEPLVRLSDAQAIIADLRIKAEAWETSYRQTMTTADGLSVEIADLRGQVQRLTGERDAALRSAQQSALNTNANAEIALRYSAELDALRAAASKWQSLAETHAKLDELKSKGDERADRLRLRAAAGEAKQDAKRYRWLRAQHWSRSDSPLVVVSNGKDVIRLGTNCPSDYLLDEAIDRAMAPAADGEKQ